MNGTQTSSCFNPTAERIGKTTVYCLIFIVSLVLNISIGIIVYKTKTMRKPINFLIVNMAMSDLLYPFFVVPPVLTKLYLGSWQISGPLGQALCKLAPFFQHVSDVVSIQSLVLIAVDRFRAIVFPLRSPLISSKLCPFFILATWIIAMIVQCPELFTLKLVKNPGGLACVQQWNEAFGEYLSFKNYILAVFIIFFFVPLSLIVVLYLAILFKLKSQKIPGEQSVNAGEQRVKREKNVLKMSIAIVLAFAVCYFPLAIYWFLSLFQSDSNMISSCGFQYITTVGHFLGYSYCAVNPCICFIFSGNYRQGLKNLLS